jgi:plastocyanin
MLRRAAAGSIAAFIGAGILFPIGAQSTFSPASAAQTFEVEVGRFLDPGDESAESMRFYPAELKVASGDTIHFTTQSLHGVALLPAGSLPADWAGDNAGAGGPWSLFERDRDEGAQAARLNLRVATPSAACGWPGQEACEFDGTGDPTLGPQSSGLALYPTASGSETRDLSFTTTITADPGTTIYAIDPLHPAMTMKIDVVGTLAERSDPGALAAANGARFESDRALATRLHRSYSDKKVKRRVAGKTVWQAWAGIQQQGVALRRFYPTKLTIRRGQRVRWAFPTAMSEPHSVTFPRSRAAAIAGSFPQVVCDTNGDEDPTPDQAPTSADFPFCDSFGSLELDVPSALIARAGNGKVTSSRDVESSGARGANYTGSAAYQLVFPKKSTGAGYLYGCAIHESAGTPMRSTVVVK